MRGRRAGQGVWTWVESDEIKLMAHSPPSGTLALEGPVSEGLPGMMGPMDRLEPDVTTAWDEIVTGFR